MPSLVYVLALSGGIHIINYYHDAIRDGCPLDKAPDVAISHGLVSLHDGGRHHGLGSWLLACESRHSDQQIRALCCVGSPGNAPRLIFLYLPSLLYYYPSRKFAAQCAESGVKEETESILLKFWRSMGGFVIRNNTLVSLGCIAVMVFFVFGLILARRHLPREDFNQADESCFPPGAEIINHYTWLEDHLGPLVPMEVLLTVDNETCDMTFLDRMRLAHEIEELIETELEGDVGGALSAATLAPDISESKGSFVARRANESGLTRRLEAHRNEFHEYLATDTERTTTNDPNLMHLRISDHTAGLLKGGQDQDPCRHSGPRGPDGHRRASAPQRRPKWKPRLRPGRRSVTRSIDELASPDMERLGIPAEVARSLYAADVYTLRDLVRLDEKHEKLTDIKGIGLEEYRLVKDARNAWKDKHLAFKESGIEPRYVDVLKAKGIRDLKTLEPRNLALIEGGGQARGQADPGGRRRLA